MALSVVTPSGRSGIHTRSHVFSARNVTGLSDAYVEARLFCFACNRKVQIIAATKRRFSYLTDNPSKMAEKVDATGEVEVMSYVTVRVQTWSDPNTFSQECRNNVCTDPSQRCGFSYVMIATRCNTNINHSDSKKSHKNTSRSLERCPNKLGIVSKNLDNVLGSTF